MGPNSTYDAATAEATADRTEAEGAPGTEAAAEVRSVETTVALVRSSEVEEVDCARRRRKPPLGTSAKTCPKIFF